MPGSVFLSYRRAASWPMARLVRQDLSAHGFDVFLDMDGLDSGDFDPALLREIETRTHFLVLLVPGALDRIGDERDWLRREVRHALTHHRNVVPLLADGFRMPDGRDLPTDVAGLATRNAVSVPADYFDEAMTKLRQRFLRIAAVPPAVKPPSPAVELPSSTGPSVRAVDLGGTVRLEWDPLPAGLVYELHEVTNFFGAALHRGRETRYRTPWPARGRVSYRVRTVPPLHPILGVDPGPWGRPVDVVRPASRASADVTPRPRVERAGSGVRLAWPPVLEAVGYVAEVRETTMSHMRASRSFREIYRGETCEHVYAITSNPLHGQRHEFRVRAQFAPDEVGPWSMPVELDTQPFGAAEWWS